MSLYLGVQDIQVVDAVVGHAVVLGHPTQSR
jgi:hypothetical protein